MSELELKAESICSGYGEKEIVHNVDLNIPANKINVIIGANGCGKSTLLKTFARLIKPMDGAVTLDGKEINTIPSKKLARQLGLLPQTSIVPEGIRVMELVSRGRYPYRDFWGNLKDADYKAIEQSLEMVDMLDKRDYVVDELSGGQKQRVWLALALAQQTDILLLDEPTTYLDIAYQIEILDLLAYLNKEYKTTIVMVLHDINLSTRYADYLHAMKNGRLLVSGKPQDIITVDLIKDVYGLDSVIIDDPVSHTPYVIPKGKYHVQ